MYSIRKVQPMKVNHFQISISMLLTIVFIFYTGCQGTDEATLYLSEAMDKETPSQSATRNFMNSLNIHEVERSVIMDNHVQEKESRTSVFQKSLIKYVKEIYNRKDYPQALSQDGSHILQFMDLSNELNLGAETVYVYMRLFYNKIKACEVIDDAMIVQLLETMPHKLERHFISEHEDQEGIYDLAFIKHQIESTMLSKFTEHLPSFQSEPDIFISNLAQDLASYYQQEIDRSTKQKNDADARERLRTIIIKFFDLGLNKTMWTPETYQNPWESFNIIGDGLVLLAQYGIVKHMDDLDDLFWSLTHRFCFFLDLAGASLPLDLYEEIERDLDNCSVPFLEMNEQDEGITSKKETLFECLLQAKARAFAYERSGIISMPMITRAQENMTMSNEIIVGKTYQHYSGKEYRVLGFSRHSETLEEMVVYQGLYDCPKFGPNPIWVRSKAMFAENVMIEGAQTPRFKIKQLEENK